MDSKGFLHTRASEAQQDDAAAQYREALEQQEFEEDLQEEEEEEEEEEDPCDGCYSKRCRHCDYWWNYNESYYD